VKRKWVFLLHVERKKVGWKELTVECSSELSSSFLMPFVLLSGLTHPSFIKVNRKDLLMIQLNGFAYSGIKRERERESEKTQGERCIKVRGKEIEKGRRNCKMNIILYRG
jgi:hypothetical protein